MQRKKSETVFVPAGRDGDLLEGMAVGARITFSEERLAYTAQAVGRRFLVCTKPFNPMRTVLYTIVDRKLNMRGPENLVFGAGAETREQCEAMLERLESGETELSRRRWIPLSIARVRS